MRAASTLGLKPSSHLSTRASVGSSSARDPGEAAAEIAAAIANSQALGGPPDVLVAFATAAHDQELFLKALGQAFPTARRTGCSGEGVIVREGTFETDYYAAVLALRSPTVGFVPFLFDSYGTDSASAGGDLATLIGETPDVFGVLVFPDGLLGNCTEFLETLDRETGPEPVVVGGTSGDGMRMERTWQYLDDRATTGAVAGLILTGPGRVAWAVSHGCTPIGLERTVTDAADGWVREIDGQPAWDVFKEYLPGDPQALNAEGIIHLCVGLPLDGRAVDEYGDFRIVTPMSLDPDTGALYFPGGGIESGARIRLTRRDERAIRDSASDCARRVSETGDPAFVLQFDCAGRGHALFGARAADEMVRPLQAKFDSSVPWIGFHTYGEIAPIAGSRCYHNYTVVLCGVHDV